VADGAEEDRRCGVGRARATRYTFGDGDAAARRLELLATTFEPSSREFLRNVAPRRPRLAVDLGCGPGFSTALVAATTGAARTVGLDRSAAFVDAARRAFPTLEFIRHDVATGSFPTSRPDLVFARLLLAHLPDPVGQARRWAHELAPGGRLLLEEMEWIDAADPVLAEYEARVLAVVRQQGAPMYAGPLLGGLGEDDLVHPAWTAVRTASVPTPVAARIYALNLDGWRRDPFAVEHFRDDELEELAARLARLAADGHGRVRWGLRQLMVERRA
jgi:SAM-dependent methyltransferase